MMRIDSIDYFYLRAYAVNSGRTHAEKLLGAGAALGIFLSSFFYSILCVISEYIFDIKDFLEIWYPWRSMQYKSPLNPQTFPLTICGVAALVVLSRGFNSPSVHKLLRSCEKVSGSPIVVVSVFAWSVAAILVSRVRPELAFAIYLVLLGYFSIRMRKLRRSP